jgi:TRAP-type transport system periplasmic protein
MSKKFGFLLPVLLLALAIAPFRTLAQQAGTTLRIGMFAPRGSTWHRVFTAWGNSLREQSGGRVTVEVTPGLQEAEVVRRLRAGELDGANLTAVGLGQVVQPVLVLQAPGVYENYAQLDRARTALDGELRGEFDRAGLWLAGWSDYGQGRIFSTHSVAAPADLRGAKPWVVPDDPMFAEFLRGIGATGVPLGIGEVAGALDAGRIDTVVASASAVSALQWHTRLRFAVRQSNAVLVGATLLSKTKVESLPADVRTMLTATANQAHESLQRTVRRDDDRFYQTLVSRGLTEVDASAHEAEWRDAARQARERMVGRVYSRAQLDRALAAAR